MAELVCEICGGKLIGKPGGIFECDSCGVQYSTEWAKAKIQEIRGTVKVEGTVNVTGEVQVTGSATKDSLLKRAKMCFDDGNAEKAKELLDQVLNADPECGEAYLYQCALNESCKTIEQLHSLCMDIDEPRVWESPEMQKTIQFSVDDCKTLLDNWVEERNQIVAADLAHRQAMLSTLEAKRKEIAPVQKFISVSKCHAVGLRSDGTVIATGRNDWGQCNVSGWSGIKSVIAEGDVTYGLKFDGTVVATGENWEKQCDGVKRWRDIVDIAAGFSYVVGLKSDGTVVATGNNDNGQCNVDDWHDIVQIATGGSHTVGLKKDGTVVAAGNNNRYGACDVSDWKNIVYIAAGFSITSGICADGTTVATRRENDLLAKKIEKWKNENKIIADSIPKGVCSMVGICKDGTVFSAGVDARKFSTSAWRDIIDVFLQDDYIIGLKSDGTTVSTGCDNVEPKKIDKWTNLVMVTGNDKMSVGLLNDGTVVTAGCLGGKEWSTKEAKPSDYRFDFHGWKLFDKLSNVEQERNDARDWAIEMYNQQRNERMKRKIKLEQEKQTLTAELKNVKGLFAGMKRKDLEERINRIDTQILDLE